MKSFRWGMGALGLAAAGVLVLGALGIGIAAQAQGGQDGNPLHNRYLEILAGKLGISVDQLKADQEDARNQAIDEAVSSGSLTQTQGQRLKDRPFGARGLGPGLKGAGIKDAVNNVVSATTGLLGVDTQDLISELKSGKSLSAIADEHKVSRQNLIDTITGSIETQLQNAVDAGTITSDQKQKVMDAVNANIDAAVDWVPGSGKFPFSGKGLHGFHM
jgi:hypothetical protein